MHIDEIPLTLFFSRLNSPSSLSCSSLEDWSTLQSLAHLSDSLLDSLQHVLYVSYWGAQNWTQYSRCGLTTTE